MTERLQLDLQIDPASWEGQFDFIEIWRSRLLDGGPYEALMGDSWAPARVPNLPGDPPTPAQNGPGANIVGLTLRLLYNEVEEIDVTFTGSNPLTYSQAATQIQNASPTKLMAFVLNGVLFVQTKEAGSGISIRVVGGDAAPLLGLPTVEPDSIAYGLDARIALSPSVTSYTFTDGQGSKEYFYKARFYSSVDRTTSAFGPPFTGRVFSGVLGTSTIVGFADFVDVNGIARANQEVLIYTRADGKIVDGKIVVPTAPTRMLSDTDGHIELSFIRGTKITVAIAGTDIVRDIDVPTDQALSSFNLLDPTKGKNDLFKVQIPDLEYAARRSL